MTTIDEILASGRYTDRRGREWRRCRTIGICWHNDPHPSVGIKPRDMRLLIERDQHRDVCRGLGPCWDHPVPYVLAHGNRLFIAYDSGPFKGGDIGTTLTEAMDAARALAARS